MPLRSSFLFSPSCGDDWRVLGSTSGFVVGSTTAISETNGAGPSASELDTACAVSKADEQGFPQGFLTKGLEAWANHVAY